MRGFLLDTHAFLWLATDDPRLGEGARRAVLDPAAALYLSVASVWELAIKRSLGRLILKVPLSELVRSQCGTLATGLLPVEFEHAVAVAELEFHHRDPFDRLLVAQATLEDLVLVSRDPVFDAYGVRRAWE